MTSHPHDSHQTHAIRLFVVLCLSVFFGEMLIMVLLGRWNNLPSWGVALLDAFLLMAALFPLLYLLVLRPLATHIEERERAEQERRKGESELRATLDSTADGILAVDDHGKVLHANRRFIELWRLPPALMATGDDTALLAFVLDQMSDPAEFLAKVRALYGSDAEDFDIVRFKDGRIFERHTVPMRMDGERIGRVWSFRDVTARHEAHEAASQTQAILQAVTDGTTDAVFVKDASGVYLMCNDATCRFLGKSRAEILGTDDTAHMSADEARALMESDRRIMAAGAPCTLEEHVTTGGVRRTFSATKGPVRNAPGEVVGLFGISRDMTDWQKAQEELRQHNLFIEVLLEHAPVGFAVNRISDGGPTFTSRKFETIYGIEPGSVRDVDDFFAKVYRDPAFRKEMRARITADIMSGDIERMRWDDVPLESASGEIRYVSAANIPVPEQDLMISTVQDVTARKKMEEQAKLLQAQLVQAQRLEAVGLLAGGIAHDFNNMLAVIIGSAELAMLQVAPQGALHEDLEEIRKAAQRSADLTRQLLAFARQQTVTPRRVDLHEVVPGMLGMLKRLVGEDVRLLWEPAERLWTITIDPSQVDQILTNLCVNARQAISGVGVITLKTANCVVDDAFCGTHPDATPGDYVRLTVQDNGCGMDAATAARIFEPFFTTKAVGTGTGLGLASVYGAVRQNSGFITLATEPGLGATFGIHFPRRREEEEVVAAAEAAPPDVRGHETILVVEDEPALLRLTTRILRGMGYHVLAANGPHEAMRIAAEHAGPISLLLSDVVMPAMNGPDLADALQKVRPAMRWLFMSGHAAEVVASRSKLEPGTTFVAKPFTPGELAARVREALDPPGVAERRTKGT